MTCATCIRLFSSVCPWLILVLATQRLAGHCGLRTRGWRRLSILGLIALGCLALPIAGMSLADWVRGMSANFSIPFTALLALAVWEYEFGRKALSGSEWAAGWAFGIVAALGLYPFALGLGRFDPYGWGWGFSPLFIISAGLTAILIWKQNRFGVLLLLAIAAWQLHVLESGNYWDYLVDPVYCLAGTAVLGWQFLARQREAAAPRAP
jgi:hypothetical protein